MSIEFTSGFWGSFFGCIAGMVTVALVAWILMAAWDNWGRSNRD